MCDSRVAQPTLQTTVTNPTHRVQRLQLKVKWLSHLHIETAVLHHHSSLGWRPAPTAARPNGGNTRAQGGVQKTN